MASQPSTRVLNIRPGYQEVYTSSAAVTRAVQMLGEGWAEVALPENARKMSSALADGRAASREAVPELQHSTVCGDALEPVPQIMDAFDIAWIHWCVRLGR
jgi:hypothetical protein